MRATEKKRVDDRPYNAALREKRLDVLAHRGERLGALRPSILDERNQLWAGLLRDVNEGVEVAERAHVRAAADCEYGREHPDRAASRRGERRGGPGSDDADRRYGELIAHGLERHGG